MGTNFLDTLQLLFGIYILFFAIKGNGKIYELKSTADSNTEKVRKVLRRFYFAAGITMTVDGVASMLRNTMFELQTGENGAEVLVRKAAWLPMLSYDFLRNVTLVCFVLEIITIVLLAVYISKQSKGSPARTKIGDLKEKQ